MFDELILILIIAFIIFFLADTVWVIFLRRHTQTALIYGKNTKMNASPNIPLSKHGRRYCIILFVMISFINLII